MNFSNLHTDLQIFVITLLGLSAHLLLLIPWSSLRFTHVLHQSTYANTLYRYSYIQLIYRKMMPYGWHCLKSC